jgi:hypothetical protein
MCSRGTHSSTFYLTNGLWSHYWSRKMKNNAGKSSKMWKTWSDATYYPSGISAFSYGSSLWITPMRSGVRDPQRPFVGPVDYRCQRVFSFDRIKVYDYLAERIDTLSITVHLVSL